MKRLLIVSFVVLAGCATPQSQGPSPELIELQYYISSQKPLAEKGEIKWSDYFAGAYERQVMAGLPPQLYQITNKLRHSAQRYEKGELSQEDFDFEKRDSKAQWQIIANQLSEESRQRQAANMALAAQIMQNRPLIPPVQFTPITPTNVHSVSNFQLPSPPTITTGVTAMWTGNQRQVQTVTNQFGWTCEYRYGGQTFWRTFVGSCPSSIQVQ